MIMTAYLSKKNEVSWLVPLKDRLVQVKRLLCLLLMLSAALSFCNAQTGDTAKSANWQDSMVRGINEQLTLLKSAATDPADVVTQFAGKTEYWKIISKQHGPDSLQYITVWGYAKHVLYKETYVERGGDLIYAQEAEYFMPPGQHVQTRWNCTLFFHDNKLFDMQSLGHGKTEDPGWDEHEIEKSYHKRKKQLATFKD